MAAMRADASGSDEEPLRPIEVPYLLVLFPVGFVVHEGRWYIDPLWSKDLVEHTRYLRRLTLVSYLLPAERRTPEWIDMSTVPELSGVRCVGMARPRSLAHALTMLPRTWWTIWKEARRHVVVHSGFSWPIGEGWLLGSMQWLHRNFQVILIESATWRLAPGVDANWRQRLRAVVNERINRYFTERADLAVFTQEEYRRTLRTRRLENAHVIEATWIDQSWVIDDGTLSQRAEALAAQTSSPLRLMFAGRLTQAKGILWLVESMAGWPEALQERLHLDIFGDGPLTAALTDAVARLGLQQRVRLCGSLAYGAPFLAELSRHDILIVPSLSDEQPRVVYDAYSQGLPVIASDTPGLAQCVADGSSGWLYAVGDPAALAALLDRLTLDRPAIATAARHAVGVARRMTHREMHRRRWRLLSQALAAWPAAARTAQRT
jgi:glycosyltransferase involved in cell wall biosynthesis